MDQPTGLEGALAQAEVRAGATLKAAAAVVRELKRVEASARTGQLRNLARSLEAAEELVGQLAAAATDQANAWTFKAEAHMESGAFTEEVLAEARERKVKAFEQDGQIVSYPSLVKVQPGNLAVAVDKKRLATVRPSVVVTELEKLQNRPPRLNVQRFLEALFDAYEIQVERGGIKKYDATVRLVDLYKIFTLLPGAGSDYSKQEFARDLYLLDQSGTTTTKSGRQLRFAASTLTKGGGGLATVSKQGQQKIYAGVSFS